MKAVVLCGGLGTRLGALTKEMPKPLIAVAGRPFIAHVLDRLTKAGMTSLVLAVGFQWRKLQHYVGQQWNGIPVQYSVETIPLGTGGAIYQAMMNACVHEALIVNGDTLFDIDIPKFLHFARSRPAVACIALRNVEDCSRYGRVTVDSNGSLQTFGEKGHSGPGLINGGIYFLRRGALDNVGLTTFSFEADFLEARQQSYPIYAMPFDDYFIDIGIPADLQRAQTEFMTWKKR